MPITTAAADFRTVPSYRSAPIAQDAPSSGAPPSLPVADAAEIARLLGGRAPPPLQPEVLYCVAFDPPKVEVATTVGYETSSNTQRVEALVKDPFYLELAGVPVGAVIEIVNLSAYPNGTFDTHAVTLNPTGYRAAAGDREPPTSKRAGKRGLCGVFLGADAMAEASLSGNSKLLVRVVDTAGRASAAKLVTVSVSAADLPGAEKLDDVLKSDTSWASRSSSASSFVGSRRTTGGTLVTRDVTTTTETTKTTKTTKFVGGAWRARLLEGDGCVQEIRAGDGWDHQRTTLLAKNVRLAPCAGKLQVLLDRAVEPDASVTIENTRTGSRAQGEVAADGRLALPLMDDVATGDVLRFVVADRIQRSSYANTTETMAVVDETRPGGLRFDVDPGERAPPLPARALGGAKAHPLALPNVGAIPTALKPQSFPNY